MTRPVVLDSPQHEHKSYGMIEELCQDRHSGLDSLKNGGEDLPFLAHFGSAQRCGTREEIYFITP